MSTNVISPNMALVVPTVGQEPGPAYATDVSAALLKVDAHTHTGAANSDGLQIPSAGINFNADLNAQSNNLIGLRSTRFSNQGSNLVGVGDVGCLYELSGDLWYNNGAGVPVQVTAGGSLISIGSDVYNEITVSTNHTIGSGDTTIVVFVDPSSGAVIVTLPLIASVAAGRFYMIKDATGHSKTHNVTVAPSGSDTIDGHPNYDIADNFSAILLVSNGAGNWGLFVFDRKVYRGEEILMLEGSDLQLDSTSTLEVGGLVTLGAACTVAGHLSANGGLTIATGGACTGGFTTDTLTCSGGSTLHAVTCTTLGASGNSTVGGTLGVTGLTTCSGGLSVVGTSTLAIVNASSLVTCNAGLDVYGASLTVGTSLAPEDLIVAGNITGGGSALVTTSLSVGTDCDITGICLIGGACNMGGALVVGAGAAITGALSATGAVTCAGVNSSGNLTFTSTGVINFTTPRTFSRAFPFTSRTVADATWTQGSPGAWQQTSTSTTTSIFGAFRVPNGATITRIRVWVTGGAGHTAFFPAGVTVPTFTLGEFDVSTNGAVASSFSDASGSSAAYQTLHAIDSGVISMGVNNVTSTYQVMLTAESGVNAQINLLANGFEVFYTASQMDDGGD